MQIRWIAGCFVLILMISQSAIAGWSGPQTCFIGQWGHGVGQLRYDNGDGETVPEIDAVTPDGKIIISDYVSHKQVVVGPDGKVIKDVNWTIIRQEGGRTTYKMLEYGFYGEIIAFSNDGNMYFKRKTKYYLVSPTGQDLKTFESYPEEIKKSKYKDKISGLTIVRFNMCDEKIAELHIADDKKIPEFGDPLILPNGDVYIWKNTANYLVLKWTWTDEPALDKPCQSKMTK